MTSVADDFEKGNGATDAQFVERGTCQVLCEQESESLQNGRRGTSSHLDKHQHAPCCIDEILGVEADVSAYPNDRLESSTIGRLVEVFGQAGWVVFDHLLQAHGNRRRRAGCHMLGRLIPDEGEEEVFCGVGKTVECGVGLLEGTVIRQTEDERAEQGREFTGCAAILCPVVDRACTSAEVSYDGPSPIHLRRTHVYATAQLMRSKRVVNRSADNVGRRYRRCVVT